MEELEEPLNKSQKPCRV